MSKRRANSLTRDPQDNTQNPSLRRSQSQTFFDPSNPPHENKELLAELTVDLDTMFADLSEALLLQAAKDYESYQKTHFQALCLNLKDFIENTEFNSEEKIPQLLDCLHAYAIAHIRGEHDDHDILPTGVFSYIPQLLNLLPNDARAVWIRRIYEDECTLAEELSLCNHPEQLSTEYETIKCRFQSAFSYFLNTQGIEETFNHGRSPYLEITDSYSLFKGLAKLYNTLKTMNTDELSGLSWLKKKMTQKKSSDQVIKAIFTILEADNRSGEKTIDILNLFLPYARSVYRQKKTVGPTISQTLPHLRFLLTDEVINALAPEPEFDDGASTASTPSVASEMSTMTTGSSERNTLYAVIDSCIEACESPKELLNVAKLFEAIRTKLTDDQLDALKTHFAAKIDELLITPALGPTQSTSQISGTDVIVPANRLCKLANDLSLFADLALLDEAQIARIHQAIHAIIQTKHVECRSPTDTKNMALSVLPAIQVLGSTDQLNVLFIEVARQITGKILGQERGYNSHSLEELCEALAVIREVTPLPGYVINSIIVAIAKASGDIENRDVTITGNEGLMIKVTVSKPGKHPYTAKLSLINELVDHFAQTHTRVGHQSNHPYTQFNKKIQRLVNTLTLLLGKESPDYIHALFANGPNTPSVAEKVFYQRIHSNKQEREIREAFFPMDFMAARDSFGNTGLHWLAIASKHPQMIYRRDEWTIKPHNLELMDYLLTHSPELVTARNAEGEDAFQFAVRLFTSNPESVFIDNIFGVLELLAPNADPACVLTEVLRNVTDENHTQAFTAYKIAVKHLLRKKADDAVPSRTLRGKDPEKLIKACSELSNKFLQTWNDRLTQHFTENEVKDIQATVVLSYFQYVGETYPEKVASKPITMATKDFLTNPIPPADWDGTEPGLLVDIFTAEPNRSRTARSAFTRTQSTAPILDYFLHIFQAGSDHKAGPFFEALSSDVLSHAFDLLDDEILMNHVANVLEAHNAILAANQGEEHFERLHHHLLVLQTALNHIEDSVDLNLDDDAPIPPTALDTLKAQLGELIDAVDAKLPAREAPGTSARVLARNDGITVLAGPGQVGGRTITAQTLGDEDPDDKKSDTSSGDAAALYDAL